jgi:hypothetical protein
LPDLEREFPPRTRSARRWVTVGRLVDRFNAAVCHRAFSSPEAWTYELLVARAAADVVTPLLAAHARVGRSTSGAAAEP